MRGAWRRVVGPVALVTVGLGLTACGLGPSPYSNALNRFDGAMGSLPVAAGPRGWTVWVAHGTVWAGWAWFRRPTPVVYTQVWYTGPSNASDVVIHFGRKTVTSPAQASHSGLGFYLRAARIPPQMRIVWRHDGRRRRVTIDAAQMKDLTGTLPRAAP